MQQQEAQPAGSEGEDDQGRAEEHAEVAKSEDKAPWGLDVRIPHISVHLLASIESEPTVAIILNEAACRYLLDSGNPLNSPTVTSVLLELYLLSIDV